MCKQEATTWRLRTICFVDFRKKATANFKKAAAESFEYLFIIRQLNFRIASESSDNPERKIKNPICLVWARAMCRLVRWRNTSNYRIFRVIQITLFLRLLPDCPSRKAFDYLGNLLFFIFVFLFMSLFTVFCFFLTVFCILL